MSKAEEALTARATRAAKRESGEPTANATTPPATPPPIAPRSRPVRLTLDLAPVQHRKLTRWCADAAYELGLSKVPATSVIRLLIGQLASDPELAARIQALIPGELTT
jgi:hypothetical protein